jgi:predicted nicotinamide N-methyase
MALARYTLDNPSVVDAKRVLDLGSGSGLAAIAAARCGATSVVACDLDPLASVVQNLNGALNGVTVESVTGDVVNQEWDVDVILAGDVCYERESAETLLAWLRSGRAEVLIADPGRHYAPSDGLELLANYDVPTLMELESAKTKRTRLWRLIASAR